MAATTPDGYVLTAWAKDGRLVVGRCAYPDPVALGLPGADGGGMVQGWIVRDTAKALGRATFGDDFSHEGPSCVYGGSCANPPAGEKYPGAWAESTLAGLRVASYLTPGATVAAVPDPKAAVAAVLAGPETPLNFDGARAALGVAGAVLTAFRDTVPPPRRDY